MQYKSHHKIGSNMVDIEFIVTAEIEKAMNNCFEIEFLTGTKKILENNLIQLCFQLTPLKAAILQEALIKEIFKTNEMITPN